MKNPLELVRIGVCDYVEWALDLTGDCYDPDLEEDCRTFGDDLDPKVRALILQLRSQIEGGQLVVTRSQIYQMKDERFEHLSEMLKVAEDEQFPS